MSLKSSHTTHIHKNEHFLLSSVSTRVSLASLTHERQFALYLPKDTSTLRALYRGQLLYYVKTREQRAEAGEIYEIGEISCETSYVKSWIFSAPLKGADGDV